MTSPTPSDSELLAQIILKDEESFRLLYERHQAPVYRFALMMSGNASVAEDVTQDVFLVLMRNPKRFDPSRGELRSFLLGVARNRVRHHGERGRASEPVAETIASREDPFADCASSEDIERVRRAVLQLPPRYREVVV